MLKGRHEGTSSNNIVIIVDDSIVLECGGKCEGGRSEVGKAADTINGSTKDPSLDQRRFSISHLQAR